MNTKIGLLAAAMTIGLVASASAEQLRGPYVGIAGGVNLQGFSDNADAKVSGPRGQTLKASGSYSVKTGWVVLGSLGYAFGNGFRIELEPGYRYNKLDNLKVNGLGKIAKNGHLDSWSVMANALYDIPTGTPITPYIGGGVGIAWVHAKGNNNANGFNTNSSFDDTQTEFAYQGIAGVDYSVSQNLKIGISYHYFATPDVKFHDKGLQEKLSYGNNEILLGLRYTFGQPQMAAAPMAPAPAPAPEMARSFTVFFDWNKSTITPEADAILKEAADVAKNGGVAKITVTGHTDTSGSQAYNQRLSERRAAAVKARLVQYGLGADEITTVGVGETDLLVPTKDGVREAKNRRAEIVFQ